MDRILIMIRLVLSVATEAMIWVVAAMLCLSTALGYTIAFVHVVDDHGVDRFF